ncbi:hypothetical protein BC827DRAFT_1267463 [Russula dissimulans]|nr:hypothetical protein BC827DRAFT_1267463 [Russula dissimulans]
MPTTGLRSGGGAGGAGGAGGNGGPGGGGGSGGPGGPGGAGGPGPGIGSGTNPGSGIISPPSSTLVIRRERRNIEVARNFSLQTGYLNVVSASHVPKPKRIVTTTICFNSGPFGTNSFSGIIDILLVPLSYPMNICFDLYQLLNAPSLRDNIILLDRLTFHGAQTLTQATQVDIPEDLRNRVDYQLVVTCPNLYASNYLMSNLSVSLLLDMEN